MLATLTLDGERIAKAKAITGLDDLSQVIDEALLSLIQRDAYRRVAALGGTDPTAEATPRRRFEADAAE